MEMVEQPTAVYQMPPVGTMPMMHYPVMAPTPMPSFQTQMPMVAAPVPRPQPKVEDMNKQDMIKLLLNELAKPDLEA
jgi:hypothetical protein